jgi:uncharacterized membrane protein YfcA
VASVLGSVIGAHQAHRFPVEPLKKLVLAYLLAVGIWMIVESILHAEFVLVNPQGMARWILAAGVAFVIAAISGSLGVAGGEMRIPALLYLFGYDVKAAGTISLLASIPTAAAGAFTYRRMGSIPNRAVVVALVMGAGSLIGVMLGTSLLPMVDQHVIKALLGAILLTATACLALPVFFRSRARAGRSGS